MKVRLPHGIHPIINGAPREMVCRGLMLALWRAGHIELPAVRRRPPNPLSVRTRPQPIAVDSTPLQVSLRELGPLSFSQVRRTAEEARFNSLLEAHHYLGYSQPVGEQLKFMVYAATRPVALFAWSSAPRHLGPRDRFLGWSPEGRRQNIGAIAYNTRYLILPWVQVEHLASHLLGRMTRQLSSEWQRVYGHPVHFAETFIDRSRGAPATGRRTGFTWARRKVGAKMTSPTGQTGPSRMCWACRCARIFAEIGRAHV